MVSLLALHTSDLSVNVPSTPQMICLSGKNYNSSVRSKNLCEGFFAPIMMDVGGQYFR